MKTFWNIVLIIVIVFIAIKVKDKFFPNTSIITQTVTDTIVTTDTIYKDSIVYTQLPTPNPDTVVEVHMDTTHVFVDSAECEDSLAHLYNRYYSQYFYFDTVVDNSELRVKFGEIISQNQPVYRELSYQILRPAVINNTTTINSQREFYLGVEFGVQTFQPTFTYQSLNDFQYSVGYDLVGQERGIRFGVHARLSHLWGAFQ